MIHISSQQLYLSHHQTDWEAVSILRSELEKSGLPVFREKNTIRLSDGWLTTLQNKIQHCSAFVALIGRNGLQHWNDVELQIALARNTLPHNDAQWLPIYLLLLTDADSQKIPPLLSAFQPLSWQIDYAVPKILLTSIRARIELRYTNPPITYCPYLGINTFKREHAPLFFGRHKEILDIIRHFGTQSQVHPDYIQREGEQFCRWLQIEGASVTGKSSLINAGLLPMIEQGALWPRTGFKEWIILGPMVPGNNPLMQLAELLDNALITVPDERDINKCYRQLLLDDSFLCNRLNTIGQLDVGFILIIDQFEELFSVEQKDEQRRFDAQLAHALLEKDSPFFLMTSVITGFLEGFERLLYLSECYNTRCKRYALASVSEAALRDIIEKPAQLAGLNVKDVIGDILANAQHEAGVLPLVGNTLKYLWEHRNENHLTPTVYQQKGGITGLLETQADDLLNRLEQNIPGGKLDALKLLLALTRISPDGCHTRQRISLDEAINIAGQQNTQHGQKIIDFLSGKSDTTHNLVNNHGGLRLITLQGNGNNNEVMPSYQQSWHTHQCVDLLYEQLIRPRDQNEKTGQVIGYWQTLYDYINASTHIDVYQHFFLQKVNRWENSRGFWRWWNLASWKDLRVYHKLGFQRDNTTTGRFIYWSIRAVGAQIIALVLASAFIGQSFYWTQKHGLPLSYMLMQQQFRLISAGVLPAPLPDMVSIEADDMPAKIIEPDITWLEDGALVIKDTEFAKPNTDVGLTKRFNISKHEITYQQYDYYVWEQEGKINYPVTAKGGRNQHPVVNVSWNDANGYLAWLSNKTHHQYRLPTEAEWEYADRAKTTTDYWWGNGIGRNKANCIDCGTPWDGKESAPVGSFAPNGFGLYDTVGNVYEWTCSAWKEQPDGSEYTCSTQSTDLHVFLGGSWRNRSVFLLYSSRDWDVAGFSRDNIGFRAARIDV